MEELEHIVVVVDTNRRVNLPRDTIPKAFNKLLTISNPNITKYSYIEYKKDISKGIREAVELKPNIIIVISGTKITCPIPRLEAAAMECERADVVVYFINIDGADSRLLYNIFSCTGGLHFQVFSAEALVLLLRQLETRNRKKGLYGLRGK